jgi:hypothetical protein
VCAIGISIAAIRLSYIFGNEGSKIVFIIECISGLGLLAMSSFAVAYLTGEEGPVDHWVIYIVQWLHLRWFC